MHSLIKTSATLLILIAAFGTAGTAAGSLVDEARGLLDAQAADLEALEGQVFGAAYAHL